MKNPTTTIKSGARPRLFRIAFNVVLLPTLVLLLRMQTSYAGSATWNFNPISDDWNTAANWTPETVPNSPEDTATFGVSNVTNVSTSQPTEVKGIVFPAGASAFTITVTRLSFSASTLVELVLRTIRESHKTL